MRISIDWLKEFVTTNDSIEEIANTLTMLGLEAESGVDYTQLKDIIIYVQFLMAKFNFQLFVVLQT